MPDATATELPKVTAQLPGQFLPLLEPYRYKAYYGGRGGAKAICDDEVIPTPAGWTRLGDICVGDVVFDETGSPCRVTEIHIVANPDTAYQLRFSDGATVDCDGGHEWVTWTDNERKSLDRSSRAPSSGFPSNWPSWRRQANSGNWGWTQTGPRARSAAAIVASLDDGHCIPLAQSLWLPALRLSVDPYDLGLLGEGDHDLIEYCLRGAVEQRLDLLHGLMERAGTLYADGHVGFSPRDRALVWQVFELVASLGMRPVVFVRHGEHLQLRWWPLLPAFRAGTAKAEQARQARRGLRTRQRWSRRIVGAVSIAPKPMRCLTVDSPNHMYLVGRWMIPTHNSWQFARVLVIQAHHAKHLILCTREFQNSIADSVHRVIRRQIEALGLLPWFDIEKISIRSKLTGSEFIFKGLQRNIAEIRSLEGVTRTWIEEAQSTSEDSWVYLEPTVLREPGAELWTSFNPVDESDPTYQRMVLKPPPGALVRKVGWQDNPWFPPELDELRRHALRTDPDRYDWVWEGHCRKISEAAVFRGRYSIEGFETPDDVDRFYLGADWGFSVDPSVLVRAYIRDDTLYVDHEAYAVGVEIDDLPALFAGGVASKTGISYPGVPGARDWPIRADCSQPAQISYLARRGFSISGAEKWTGSVEDGIQHLKAFKRIVVHERCVNTAQELRLYSYKTDPKTGDALPKLEDKHNHAIDSLRYSLDGYILRRGGIGVWAKL